MSDETHRRSMQLSLPAAVETDSGEWVSGCHFAMVSEVQSDAGIRGANSTHRQISPCWTRFLSWGGSTNDYRYPLIGNLAALSGNQEIEPDAVGVLTGGRGAGLRRLVLSRGEPGCHYISMPFYWAGGWRLVRHRRAEACTRLPWLFLTGRLWLSRPWWVEMTAPVFAVTADRLMFSTWQAIAQGTSIRHALRRVETTSMDQC